MVLAIIEHVTAMFKVMPTTALVVKVDTITTTSCILKLVYFSFDIKSVFRFCLMHFLVFTIRYYCFIIG